MQDAKDIAVAVLGASLGVAALLVVFMGFLLAYAESFPEGTPDKIQKRFKSAARWGLVPTVAAVMESLASYTWLFWRNDCIFWMWVVGFVVVALALLLYATVTVLMVGS